MKNIQPAQKHQFALYLKWCYRAVLLGTVLFLLIRNLYGGDKIAYVDSAKILSDYKGSEEAKKTYQSKAKVWQANIDTLTNEVKATIKTYEKSLAAMSKKEQELSKQLIETKQRQLADYQKGIQANAKQEDGKLTQYVVSQIDAYLTKYGQSHNYKIILIANQSGTIAYAKEGLDITTDVLGGLNKEYLSSGK